MKVSELKTEMNGKFAAVDERFERVDHVLEDLRQQITSEAETLSQRISSEFKGVRRDLGNDLDQRIKSGFEDVRRDLGTDLDQRIKSGFEDARRDLDEMVTERVKSEGETTRRHFDVVAEKMVSERNLALDRSMATAQQLLELTASNAGDHARFERRLDDHDRRLEKIEQRHDTDPS